MVGLLIVQIYLLSQEWRRGEREYTIHVTLYSTDKQTGYQLV